MLVTSIFSFSHNVFLPSPLPPPQKKKKKKKKFNFFGQHIVSSANALNLDQFKILSFGEELKKF